MVGINANLIVHILRVIFCNSMIMTWLESQAKKSDTPIDDTVIKIVKLLLCDDNK